MLIKKNITHVRYEVNNLLFFCSKRLASIPSSSWKTQDGMRPRPCSSLRTPERSMWRRTCSRRSCTRRGVSKSKDSTKWKVLWNNPWYDSSNFSPLNIYMTNQSCFIIPRMLFQLESFCKGRNFTDSAHKPVCFFSKKLTGFKTQILGSSLPGQKSFIDQYFYSNFRVHSSEWLQTSC